MRMKLPLALAIFAGLMLPTSVAAIVKRHDISDAAYLALESEFPALFTLYKTEAGHGDCIATLVAPQWAITAAHCTRDKKFIEALAKEDGGHPVSIDGHVTSITHVVRYPGSETFEAPDIAMLKLRAPITHVRPMPLYRETDEQGRRVLIPGWGGTGDGKMGLGQEDGFFRVAENIVDSADGPILWWIFDQPQPSGKAITLEGISGPGDSGGPALISTPDGLAVAGISAGQDSLEGPEGLYGVMELFIRISSLIPWIEDSMEEDRSAADPGT